MIRHALSDVERCDWLRLSRAENVGAIIFKHLIQRYGSAAAALKSGSLITAGLALEQGREVFAVPGSPLDPRCTGTNDLIRQGAVLTESANDVLTHIHAMPTNVGEPPVDEPELPLGPLDESELAKAREIILENLGPSPVSVDELIRECGLVPSVALTVLLELELAGRIGRQAGHRVALIASAEQDNVNVA